MLNSDYIIEISRPQSLSTSFHDGDCLQTSFFAYCSDLEKLASFAESNYSQQI